MSQQNIATLPIRALQVGFTLVEMMVVIVILSVFAGMMSLSLGSSDTQKNRAFYEHLIDSLSYVRLLSAERTQPMGLSLRADKQGQITPVIVMLSNPYSAYQNSAYQTPTANTDNQDSTPKNAMELSVDITGLASGQTPPLQTPSWELVTDIALPEMPTGVSVSIQSLDGDISAINATQTRTLQPWFTNNDVPQVLWLGTGQATPVTIEVRYDSRLVGDVITIMPDGSMTVGQGL